MSSTYFRYFDTSASMMVAGDKFRVLASSPLAKAFEEDPGVIEQEFSAWWDTQVSEDTKERALDGAPEGTFFSEWNDPEFHGSDESGYVRALCSLETGEPVELTEETA